jgi:methylase of polypeptide subunit release factors
MLPFDFGTSEQLADLRRFLIASDYTEETICKRMDIPSLYDFVTLRQGREPGKVEPDRLDVLVGLFLDGAKVPESLVQSRIPEAILRLLLDLRMVRQHPEDPESLAASILLYPTQGFYVASDLGLAAPGVATPEEQERPDYVYPAITTNTGNFVSHLSRTRCERFLELCGGTGIAALIASRDADHAWTADVTERSAAFASLNAALNGVENFSSVRGDLYEPVEGMTFDRIVAHPPYVPSPDNSMIYAHGGRDGEHFLHRILADLHRFLEPGGSFYCTCVATDRKDAPLELRLREMMGESNADFDMLIATHYEQDPGQFSWNLVSLEMRSLEWADKHIKLYKELNAVNRVYFSLLLRRHDSSRKPITLRRRRHASVRGEDMDQLLDLAQILGAPDGIDRLLEARPVVSPHARLVVQHEAREGAWCAVNCRLLIDRPFPDTIELSLNSAMLVAGLEGDRTSREQLQRLRTNSGLAPEVTDEMFGEFLRNLVLEGAIGAPDLLPIAGAPILEPAGSSR